MVFKSSSTKNTSDLSDTRYYCDNCTLASFLHCGASCWQGPHHGAKKSTNQRVSLSPPCTSFVNFSLSRTTTGGLNVSYQEWELIQLSKLLESPFFFSMNRYMNFINKEIVKHNFSVWLLIFLKNSITKMYLIIFMLTFFKKSQNIKLQKF